MSRVIIKKRADVEREKLDSAIAAAKANRVKAFREEADVLFLKMQAGEDGVTKEQWLAKREEIRERYPVPGE